MKTFEMLGRRCVMIPRMSSEAIIGMHESPFRSCPDCGGTGLGCMQYLLMGPLVLAGLSACSKCNGSGMSQYICMQ